MEIQTCSIAGWNNKIEYYHNEEESYHLGVCAYSMFKESEFDRIGSDIIVKQMTELGKNIMDKVQDYAYEGQLTTKWKKALDKFDKFYDEIDSITRELEETLKTERISNLFLIQKRWTNLRSQIFESELYK